MTAKGSWAYELVVAVRAEGGDQGIWPPCREQPQGIASSRLQSRSRSWLDAGPRSRQPGKRVQEAFWILHSLRHQRYGEPASDAVEDNVKRLIGFVSLCAMVPLMACTAIGDGTRDSCVGPYVGTFEVVSSVDGPLEGRVLGFFGLPDRSPDETPEEAAALQPTLSLTLTFDTETEMPIMDQSARSNVSEAGEIVSDGAFDFVGTFDFDDCTASGTWTAGNFYTDGKWRISTGHSAY